MSLETFMTLKSPKSMSNIYTKSKLYKTIDIFENIMKLYYPQIVLYKPLE